MIDLNNYLKTSLINNAKGVNQHNEVSLPSLQSSTSSTSSTNIQSYKNNVIQLSTWRKSSYVLQTYTCTHT